MYSLMIWYEDKPLKGTVQKLSTIIEPRKQYVDYRVGDQVTARCSGHGKFPAVIGKISGKFIVVVKKKVAVLINT